MSQWIVPAIGYVIATGLIGLTTKLAMQRVQWPEIVLWAAVAYVVAAVLLVATGQIGKLHLDQGAFWAALSGVFAATSLSLFSVVVRQADLSRAVPFMASYPIVTVFLAVLVLSEKISLVEGIGIGLVMSGLLVLATQAA